MKVILKLLIPLLLLQGAFAQYFPDVDEVTYESGIDFLYELGIVEGNPDGTFAPSRVLNRAEFAKLVVLTIETEIPTAPATPCFQDVSVSAWYAPYVCKLKELGMVRGVDEAGTIFLPSKEINNAEMLAIAVRVFGWETNEETTGLWYAPYIQVARERQLVSTLKEPSQGMHRKDAAEILARGIVVYDLDLPSFTDDTLYDEYFSYWDSSETLCAGENTCEEDQAAIDEAVDSLGETYHGEETRNAIATYDVEGDVISPDPEDTHRAIWDLYSILIPQEQRKDIAEFQIFSDGVNEILASVIQSDKKPRAWLLAVDVQDALSQDGSLRSAELIPTLLHEFAHILTLRHGQIRYDIALTESSTQEDLDAAKEECTFYFTGDGCSLQDSYITAFYNEFWQSIIQEHPSSWGGAEQDLPIFYEQYADQFVSEYAATDPSEDMAETFAYFVLMDKPVSDTIANKKILFFWKYPELVDLRAYIRSKL